MVDKYFDNEIAYTGKVQKYLKEKCPQPFPYSINETREFMRTCQKWLQQEERAEKYSMRRGRTPTPAPGLPRYDLDYRHRKHGSISWTHCNYDQCITHYREKDCAGWFPAQRPSCKWQSYDCTNDTCEVHLFDKRVSGYFHGQKEDETFLRTMLVNGRCTQHK